MVELKAAGQSERRPHPEEPSLTDDAGDRLIESHRALMAELTELDQLSIRFKDLTPRTIAALDNLLAHLRGPVIQHLAHEEAHLYPVLAATIGEAAVDTLIEDHGEIRRWVARLEETTSLDDAADADKVVWTLSVIAGLVNLHLCKEEVAFAQHMAL